MTFKEKAEAARRALPAQEAKPGWVPAVGDRVWTKASWIGAEYAGRECVVVDIKQGVEDKVTYCRWGDKPLAIHLKHLSPFPPQPEQVTGPDMGSEPSRTVEVIYDGCGNTIETREVTPKPDPYARHREKLARLFGTEDDVCCTDDATAYQMSQSVGNEAARLRNIAALNKELNVGTEARKARLHPVEGRSCRIYKVNER